MSTPVDLTPVIGHEVPAGTNILMTGPPMSGKRAVAIDVLTTDFTETDGAVVVTTNTAARDLLRELSERIGSGDRLYGIDCTRESTVDGDRITSINSPADLTGVGMAVDNDVSTLADEKLHPRLAVLSVSTLLVYLDFQPVYRFLHVLTGRVRSTDGIGVFTIDEDTHDQETMNTIASLFDEHIQVTEN